MPRSKRPIIVDGNSKAPSWSTTPPDTFTNLVENITYETQHPQVSSPPPAYPGNPHGGHASLSPMMAVPGLAQDGSYPMTGPMPGIPNGVISPMPLPHMYAAPPQEYPPMTGPQFVTTYHGNHGPPPSNMVPSGFYSEQYPPGVYFQQIPGTGMEVPSHRIPGPLVYHGHPPGPSTYQEPPPMQRPGQMLPQGYLVGPPHGRPQQAHHPRAHGNGRQPQPGMKKGSETVPENSFIGGIPGLCRFVPSTTEAKWGYVVGPPRKAKQSGFALWIGNLPSKAELMGIVDHVCTLATGLESVFLIVKSNCCFANFRDRESCAEAFTKIHESTFGGFTLVARQRHVVKDSTTSTASNGDAPSGAPSEPGTVVIGRPDDLPVGPSPHDKD